MKSLFFRYPYWSVCVVATLVAAFYWGLWASDRYVSEANVVLESPQISAPTLDFQSLLTGGAKNNGDMLLLRDYLLSVDMLRKIDSALGFRQHYSAPGIDFFSALFREDVPIEDLHDYYLKRVSIELDDYAQVLRLKVQAFTPEMAQSITNMLLAEGESYMNLMGQRLAAEQVKFLEKQVKQLQVKFDRAQNDLIDYQNANGLISATATVENISTVIAGLETELASLSAKRTALLSYQSSRSAEVRRVETEINAVKQQIHIERARTAQQSGGALNTLSSQYQTLELQVQFALESYSGALGALQNTRIEASRKLKQVSILQSPTLPEYPVEPRRLYNIVVFAIMAMFIALIIHMLVLIIKDHRD